MTSEHDDLDLGYEPEDLDGHTIEELSDYLDAGRSPVNPAIEASPGCRTALEAMERLRHLTPELFAEDVAAEPPAEESWIAGIMGLVALDARAGRRIPFESDSDSDDLGITEGAVRGLIRAAEAAVPGTVIGRVKINGDVSTLGAPVTIQLDVSVSYGNPIPDTVERLRADIARRLDAQTELVVTAIDINVHDIRQLPTPGEKR